MKAFWIVIFLIVGLYTHGQDPKFSQFFASPLTHNPANLGYFDGMFRFALNTRQQWANVGDPYRTATLSGELKLHDEYYYDGIISIGANGLFESAFDGVLSTSLIGSGFSYYRYLDPDHKFRFGIAPYLSYILKSVDFNKLTFSSQYRNGKFDMSLPSNLNYTNSKVGYLDLSIGGNFAVSLDSYNFYLGYAAFHLNRPDESLVGTKPAPLSIRHNLGVGIQYFTHDLMDFNFNAYRLSQGKSNDFVVGGVVGLKPHFESKSRINLGLWYKESENSYFPFVGYQFSNYSVGVNYTLTSRKMINDRPNTIEISLIITDKNYVKFENTCKF